MDLPNSGCGITEIDLKTPGPKYEPLQIPKDVDFVLMMPENEEFWKALDGKKLKVYVMTNKYIEQPAFIKPEALEMKPSTDLKGVLP